MLEVLVPRDESPGLATIKQDREHQPLEDKYFEIQSPSDNIPPGESYAMFNLDLDRAVV